MTGIGTIGAMVVWIAKGLRMEVIAFSRSFDENRANKQGIKVVDIGTILIVADYVSLHVPKRKQIRVK